VAPGDRRLSVVVPAFQEAAGIASTVARLRADLDAVAADGGLEIVVVDDGSTDRTAEAAERAGADLVVRHPLNRGKGAAVRSGVLASSGRTVVFTDADLAYSPDQIPGLVAAVEDGWDVVVGSRRHTDTTTLVRARRLREVGGRAINLLTRAVLLGQYRDTQCGLKAFRSDAARVIFSRTRVDGFAFDVEVFHLVERYHLSLAEVPVRITNSASSSVDALRDALRLVRDLFLVRQWAAEGRYDLTADDLLPIEAPTC
jgi:glycosyltransferase involved in cell wall biosynthesis